VAQLLGGRLERSEKDSSMGIMLIDACRPYGWNDQYPLANRFDDAYKADVFNRWKSSCRLGIRITVGDRCDPVAPAPVH
jgi:hypothetical protein